MKVLAAGLLIALLPAGGRAEDPPPLGATLRAYLPSVAVEGTLVASDGKTVTLQRADGRVVVPLADVTRLELKTVTERSQNAGRGAIVGDRAWASSRARSGPGASRAMGWRRP